MFKLKSSNNIYEEAAIDVSSAESNVRYWQSEIKLATSLLADLQNEKSEKIAARCRRAMMADAVSDFYDEFGRPAYLTSSDLRRKIEAEIYRLEKKLVSAEEILAERQAELERVRLILAEEEARICAPVVEEEDDEDDLVF